MKKEVYKRQQEFNSGHWWFESRKEIIFSFLKKKIKKKISILDFGCGVGVNLKMLNEFGSVYFYDRNKKIVNEIKKKFYSPNFRYLKNFNQSNKKFDLIVALDVIEHIKNDKKIISVLHKKLKKNQKILITVPAYNFLFSSKDRDLHHERRYNMETITKVLKKDFNIEKKTYFNFFLAPVIVISILLLKILSINFISRVETKPNFIVNFIFKKIFSFEKYLINFINFPFGISILIYASKKN
jgi:2-polyprenyl-3-methyl-5-hydroxy-6-metoxy-1,4-benzoquinol methylase